MIPRPTRWAMWHADDLAVLGDRLVLVAVCIVLLLYACGGIS